MQTFSSNERTLGCHDSVFRSYNFFSGFNNSTSLIAYLLKKAASTPKQSFLDTVNV